MANKQTRVESRKGDSHVALTQHESDAPIVPVAQLERLHAFRPDLVDWVARQTEIEAAERRARDKRVDYMILAERMFGKICVVAISAFCVYIAYRLAMSGHEWPAVAIGTTAAVGLATALLRPTR
ncbi:hypothetical protein [Pseudaquabacterium rugosum]|uniref:DUF2335 domain-containing protein n=1 Tax=Pseudaquabacterium rugosum TaxID=2984194 RepID=A0ABU9B639_9BURK